jgi:hypothetical protein
VKIQPQKKSNALRVFYSLLLATLGLHELEYVKIKTRQDTYSKNKILVNMHNNLMRGTAIVLTKKNKKYY